jgi:energy-coupling factor transporter ATP-binding protein EcfA2
MTRPIAQTTQMASVISSEPLPSGDDRYVPLDAARGTRNLAESLTERIIAQESTFVDGVPREYACCLVTGHRGCGKTTELYHLQELLVQENFAVVYFDAEAELNLQDLNWWNVLLEMVWQIDDQLSQPPYSLRIPDDLRDAATEWLARVVTKKTERTDMETSLDAEFGLGVGLSFFAKAKAAIKALVKTGSSTVREIEREAERRPTQLHDAVKDLITHVHNSLREQGRRSLVIIADGLEKIPLRSLGNQLTTHNNLFIHNGDHLKAPPCHLVYTLPLALLTSEKVGEVFPVRPVIMPMVHVRHQDGKEDRHALGLMAEVIKRRVSPDLFAPGVIKSLALASGGHIRDFLDLVREAASEAEARINQAHAQRAIAGLTDLYDRTIRQEFIDPLDYVASHNVLPGSSYDGQLVYLLLVLEYRNKSAWTNLHPCVQAAPRYVRAPRAKEEETET